MHKKIIRINTRKWISCVESSKNSWETKTKSGIEKEKNELTGGGKEGVWQEDIHQSDYDEWKQ